MNRETGETMNLALFDFDGTITTREMLPDFLYYSVPKSRLMVGKILLAPLLAGYRIGWVSGSVLRRAIVWLGYARAPFDAYARKGRTFADEMLPGVLRPEVMQRIRWHQSQGDQVVVVSGAFDIYLTHWCRQHGLDLICSSLEHRDGFLTGRYLGPQCVRSEKARRVRERYDLTRYAEIYAYGDTVEDEDLLAIAHRKFYQGKERPLTA